MNFFLKPIVCFVLFLSIFTVSFGNNTREYCEKLIETAIKEEDNKNYVKALAALIEAKALVNPNWGNMQIKILNHTGNIYARMFDYNTAIDYFLDAYKIALEKSDTAAQLSILNNIGAAYNYQGKQEEGRIYIEKAYQIAVQRNDSLSIGLLASNRAADLYVTKEFEQMMQTIAIAMEMLQNYPEGWEAIGNMKQLKIVYLCEIQQYDSAIALTRKSLDEFSEIESKHFKGEFLGLLAATYSKKGDKKKAIEYTKESLNCYLNLRAKIGLYGDLSKLYREENMLSSALLYQDSVIWGYDSLMSMNLDERIVSDQMRLDIFELEKQLAEKEAKQKMERTIFIGIVIFMSILAIVLIFVFRLQSTKNKQKKVIAENRQELAEKQQRIIELELEKERNQKKGLEQQLKDQEISALLEQERLNTENKELSSKIIMESNKNNLIEEMIAKLSSLPNQSQNNDLTSIIKQLKTQLEESSQWENFYSYFEKINPAFLTSLKKKHPELTRNDIQYLSYIYLNLNTKEIASLLHISEASCMKKKQRIAEKMGLKTAELHNYLLTLE